MNGMMIDHFSGEYRFLSNFYFPCIVLYKGITFLSSEHAYQTQKTLDPDEQEWLKLSKTPYMVKKRSYTVSIRNDWEYIKIGIMKDVLFSKFYNTKLEDKLIKTYPSILKEGNYWHDNFWGSCNCEKCKDKGKNVLGKLLMDIRTFIIIDKNIKI